MNLYKYTIIFITIILIPLSIASYVKAGIIVDDLKIQIAEKSSEIKKIEEEIAKYEKEINRLGGEGDTLNNSIKILNATKNKLEADIRATQANINSTTLKIEKIAFEINEKSTAIKDSSESVSEIIRKIDEEETNSFLEILLSNDSFSSFLDDIENLKQLQGVVITNMRELLYLKLELESIKSENEKQKGSLLNSKSELNDRKKITEDNKAEKDKLLRQTKDSEDAYQKLLLERSKAKKQFENELRDLESKLQFELDPSSIPKAGLGIFAPPLSRASYKSCYGNNIDGNCITQYFGDTEFAKSGAYKGSGHNGIDFRASVGTEVKTVLSGEVIAVNTQIAYMCQYGKWVLIRHANGLTTLYAHLSQVPDKIRAGYQAVAGETIGYSGSTGYSTGPHLHLTVYASKAVEFKQYTCNSGITLTIPVAAYSGYLNPLDYL